MERIHRFAAIAVLSGAGGLGTSATAQQSVTGDALRRTGTASDSMPGAWLRYGRSQSETR